MIEKALFSCQQHSHTLVALIVTLADLVSHSDVSLQDKMVIYDNERRKIGWFSTSCNKFQK